MTGVVSIDDYCKNPEDWKSKLPTNVIDYYNTICTAREGTSQHKTNIGDIGKAFGEELLHMIQGLLSPEGIGLISAVMGINFASKQMFEYFVKSLSKSLTGSVADAMAGMVAEGASEAAINCSAILSNFMSTLTLDAFGESAGKYALGTLLKGAEMIGDIISEVGDILLILQVIGMIFDAWDPCNLSNALDADTISTFNTAYDLTFRKNVVNIADSIQDVYGNSVLIYVWPLEYFADKGFLAQAKEDYYSPIRQKFMVMYLQSLDFNSDGEQINWPTGGNLVTNDILSGLGKTLALEAADENTVVANWLSKWWPLLAFFIMVLIIIIVFLIK
jgi:hypothetical protein